MDGSYMSKEMDVNKVVVFTGAGVSAESGLKTFRDSDGLWENHSIEAVATPQGWAADPELVLDFYNERRAQALSAEANKAHIAIAKLEQKYDVTVVTQNVDDLHERAGSSKVIHVHGELNKARSSVDESLVYNIGNNDIKPGDTCDRGSQLRPYIVWFGENVQYLDDAVAHIKSAGKVLVIGSSLSVYPAAGLLKKARFHAEKIIVSLDIDKKPFGYEWYRGTAVSLVPHVVETWLDGRGMTRTR